MAVCPASHECDFYQSVEPSLLKRTRFASSFPYCKGGRHEQCAVHRMMADGRRIPPGLTPNGTTADYSDRGDMVASGSSGKRFLVVDDSPVFATLAASTVRQHIPGSEVEICTTFHEAVAHVRSGSLRLVVSGYGLGDGKTVLDLRRLTEAPIVVFTGRAGDGREIPSRSRVVAKDAGPAALCGALDALLAT